jgi:hypothetical protein
MFRKGGMTNQGSGILSHVEPKPMAGASGYHPIPKMPLQHLGYADGGRIGYQTGGSSGLGLSNSFGMDPGLMQALIKQNSGIAPNNPALNYLSNMGKSGMAQDTASLDTLKSRMSQILAGSSRNRPQSTFASQFTHPILRPQTQGSGIAALGSNMAPQYAAMGGRIGFSKAGSVNDFSDLVTPAISAPTVLSDDEIARRIQAQQSFKPGKTEEQINEDYANKLKAAENYARNYQDTTGQASPYYDPEGYGAQAQAQAQQNLNIISDPNYKQRYVQNELLRSAQQAAKGKQLGLTGNLGYEPTTTPPPSTSNRPTYTESDKSKPYDYFDMKSILENAEQYKNALLASRNDPAAAAFMIARAASESGDYGAKMRKLSEEGLQETKDRTSAGQEAIKGAYDTGKALAVANIEANRLPTVIRNAQFYTDEIIKTALQNGEYGTDANGNIVYGPKGNQRTREQLLADQVGQSMGKQTAGFQLKSGLEAIQIRKQLQDLQDIKNSGGTLTKDQLAQAKKLKDQLDMYTQINSRLPYMATGGRVGLKGGSEVSDINPADINRADINPVDFDNYTPKQPSQTVQKAPVPRLTFNELRSRLPLEVNDNVINVLAKSSQALQDFSYIRSQSDVNNFNIKYGVNLVLPASA